MQLNNASVGANSVVVYVGGRSDLGGPELGHGGPGGWSGYGSSTWLNTVKTRGQGGVLSGSDFARWGGAITFSSTAIWNFNSTAPTSGQNDFLSVAVHELGHVFGVGTADSWKNKLSGGVFTGANVRAAHGGTSVAVDGSGGHFASGVKSTLNGLAADVVMQPSITVGKRRQFTRLDYAALADIGWQVPGTAA
jgi:hypothetical protein